MPLVELQIGTVYWEGSDKSRRVVGACRTCYPANWPAIEDVMLVSPTGLAHHSEGDGVTCCGRDATGPDWWWRL
jgi:hypothetical protein